jgi:hypothetical protein
VLAVAIAAGRGRVQVVFQRNCHFLSHLNLRAGDGPPHLSRQLSPAPAVIPQITRQCRRPIVCGAPGVTVGSFRPCGPGNPAEPSPMQEPRTAGPRRPSARHAAPTRDGSLCTNRNRWLPTAPAAQRIRSDRLRGQGWRGRRPRRGQCWRSGCASCRPRRGWRVPPPHTLARLDLDLPSRKREYLRAVAEAALGGLLDGAALRAVDPDEAVQRVQQVKGPGPFGAELVVVRGANAPDALPRHEHGLDAEIAERYGPARTLAEVSEGVAALPHLGRRLPGCAAGAAHRRDRRPLSLPGPPDTLSGHAANRLTCANRRYVRSSGPS